MPQPLVPAPAHLPRRGRSFLRSRRLAVAFPNVVRPQAPIAVAALITAVTLISGVSTAAAAEQVKPTSREVAKLAAPDAGASAAAARIDNEGSALGSYWDPDRAELVVVVGPDSNIGEAEAEKLV